MLLFAYDIDGKDFILVSLLKSNLSFLALNLVQLIINKNCATKQNIDRKFYTFRFHDFKLVMAHDLCLILLFKYHLSVARFCKYWYLIKCN